ncbi:MAG: hypothetical protein ACRC1K_21465 [Planctomycetia bacterium]
MIFTEEEIDRARRLHERGLPWTPHVGCYVYDAAGVIEVPSPFQVRVYFILDLKHFLRRAPSLDALKQAMVWLPQYHQCRRLLADFGVDGAAVARLLDEAGAVVAGRELVVLYDALLKKLPSA